MKIKKCDECQKNVKTCKNCTWTLQDSEIIVCSPDGHYCSEKCFLDANKAKLGRVISYEEIVQELP